MRRIAAIAIAAGVIGAGSAVAEGPRAGWVADLSTLGHGVDGFVRIIDEDTIEFYEFDYDGLGFTNGVYCYLAPRDEYDSYLNEALVIGPDLRRAQSYFNETFQIDLPEGMTVDGLYGVSVWCVALDLSFGNGLFVSPCPSDVNGDGVVSAVDIAELLSRWGTDEPLADLNQSGDVNAADLASLLSNWGPCE